MPRLISQSLSLAALFGRLANVLPLRVHGDDSSANASPILTLAGTSVVGGSAESTSARALSDTSILSPGSAYTHALYTITLPPNGTFPTDIVYDSLVILVHKGQVQVTSPTGSATVSVGAGPAIHDKASGTEVIATGDYTLGEGKSVTLQSGNSVQCADEAIEVRNPGRTPAEMCVSVVLGTQAIAADLCWICPGH